MMERLPGDGWQEALELDKTQADNLHAGRTPRVRDKTGLTIVEPCNKFYRAKHRKLKSSEIAPRTFLEYEQTTDLIVAAFGKDRLIAVTDFVRDWLFPESSEEAGGAA